MDIKASQIVMVPIEKIIPNEKNNNKHSKEQKQRAHKIFDAQGFRSPLLISNRTGKLVAGHLRLEVAKEKGVKELPCMFQDFESEEQEYQHLTADNALASWSELDLSQINTDILELGPFDIDLLGIKDFVVEPIEKFEPQADEDEVPEVVHPITRKGDIWLLGNHRLMCGDSTMIDDVEKLMNGEKADLCFTSPPYSDQRDYNGNKDLSVDKLSDFLIAPSKCFAVNLGMKRSNGQIDPYWDGYIEKAAMHGLKLISWNIWNRQGFGFSIGNATATFPIEHEFIFVFGEPKTTNKIVENNSKGRKGSGGSIRNRDGTVKRKETKTVSELRPLGTVLHICQEQERSIKHPAKFPVELPETYILALTEEKDLAYEPFAGSGTTIIAAEKNNRKCYGMELDETYCDVIINRWQNYTNKKAVLESTGQTYQELKQERGE